MPSQTNENALETLIYNHLTDRNHYQTGSPSDYDPNLAIDTAKLWQFLQTSQPDQLKKLQDTPNWQRTILERIDRKLKKDGILAVLKKGIAIHDAEFILYYSQPYNDLNPDLQTRFEQNIFSVSRQIHFSPTETTHSIDLVIFLNGLPISTIELKNTWTGQTTYHARKQYCERNPKDPLFNFARCLVHFAADTDEIWMATRLSGKSTYFLPFNKGHNHGQGNPTNPNGHKTSYLWEDLCTKTSLATILEHFALLEGKPRDPLKDKTLIFPRYHQRDAVNQLLADAKHHGPGKTYLIQHSAGSGKSNSITWLAFQLIALYQAQQDEPLFHSVIVVTDRRNLDRQLRENIKDFSEVKNIIAAANRADELKRALESGKKIIISTIQKFRFIVEGIEGLGDRRFAVIIDEAHSSQSGTSADTLNQTLNKNG
jgi:type I restriction enzyme R subunit